jgi:hypothetical protein
LLHDFKIVFIKNICFTIRCRYKKESVALLYKEPALLLEIEDGNPRRA